ncbi:hypothetical protein [Coxiella-like endosymbiont]|uniref:hypothetical protein n=1 Tax=Coxiella-like endosymbiont TaxID=1592897 RepID=UPI000C807232|nr:hypothetical protein [Coxiella-like endosymbiont]PMB54672.1 Holliday junction DNA helicase RuvB [Coxiella-like endosymbiont]
MDILIWNAQSDLKQTSGLVLERGSDLTALLTKLKVHDVYLFVNNEIHRLNLVVEAVLYRALEDF